MRIVTCYRDTEKTWETREPDVVFGRTEEQSEAVLNLFPDKKVSRSHGRIWEEGGFYWIEDLNSKWGTRLNGLEIKGGGKHQLRIGDVIVAGNTTLRIGLSGPPDAPSRTKYLEQGSILLPDARQAEVAIARDVSANLLNAVPVEVVGEEAARRLKVICDIPLQLAGKTNREALLRVIVDRLVELIPRAPAGLRWSGSDGRPASICHGRYAQQWRSCGCWK